MQKGTTREELDAILAGTHRMTFEERVSTANRLEEELAAVRDGVNSVDPVAVVNWRIADRVEMLKALLPPVAYDWR